jgi:WD40 repeat protein
LALARLVRADAIEGKFSGKFLTMKRPVIAIIALLILAPAKSQDILCTELALPPTRINFPARAISWHPGENILAMAGDDIVKIFDIVTKKEEILFEGESFLIDAIDWSYDGRYLAVSGNQIVIWDTEQKKRLDMLKFPTYEGSGIVNWHPSENLLLFSRWNYDITNPLGSMLQILNITTNEITSLGPRLETDLIRARWSPNGEFVALTDVDHFWLYSINMDELLHELYNKSIIIYDLAWNPDSDKIAISMFNPDVFSGGVISIFNSQTGESLPDLAWLQLITVKAIDWHPGNRLLASRSDTGLVTLWDILSLEQVAEIEETTSDIFQLKWSPDGTSLASNDNMGVVIWNLEMLPCDN